MYGGYGFTLQSQSTRKLKNPDFGFHPAQKYNTIWDQHRKYNMGQTHKMQDGATIDNTSGGKCWKYWRPHDVWRRSAATMCWFIMGPANISSICLRMCFLFLAHITFYVFAPYYISVRVFQQRPCNYAWPATQIISCTGFYISLYNHDSVCIRCLFAFTVHICVSAFVLSQMCVCCALCVWWSHVMCILR